MRSCCCPDRLADAGGSAEAQVQLPDWWSTAVASAWHRCRCANHDACSQRFGTLRCRQRAGEEWSPGFGMVVLAATSWLHQEVRIHASNGASAINCKPPIRANHFVQRRRVNDRRPANRRNQIIGVSPPLCAIARRTGPRSSPTPPATANCRRPATARPNRAGNGDDSKDQRNLGSPVHIHLPSSPVLPTATGNSFPFTQSGADGTCSRPEHDPAVRRTQRSTHTDAADCGVRLGRTVGYSSIRRP